ncbi:Spermatogenesis-associated protein 7-like protein [Acromyrmex echinatior]|uniref:Spermatogenesis-associated protein 7-like protein n=1 Tax=Acromyrmex echinatior TaxID=103372 RepID=F4WY95_ACREC|nr:Spermatogenesis-associated protein 7-like protein [Acromyrmex echinatior]
MTRCMKKVNLKSSTYNQTGQNYFEQLAAYNSMSAHLRRILLARSIVDTRNKIYLKKNQRYKVQRTDDSEVCMRLEATDDVIDRLAYDIRHHPMDMLGICLNAKHLDFCNCNLDQLKACSSHIYCDEIDQMDRRQRLKSERIRSSCLLKRKKFANFICKKELKSTICPKFTRDVPNILRQRCKYKKELRAPCADTRLDSTMFKSQSQSPRQTKIDYRMVSANVSQCYNFDCDEKYIKDSISKRFIFQKEEEKKYIKFVYDITKEIMQRGLYTDKELQDVFKKHINQYKGILNMSKMLYEIYQLKISLNIVDDSDTDEELEDLIHAQKLLSVSEIRPPTPPKVLDENKVMEKLESYQKMMKADRSPNITMKSVILVDANPELLITERDVLVSLVEAGVDPKQIQNICKNLRYKSRDINPPEGVR